MFMSFKQTVRFIDLVLLKRIKKWFAWNCI